MSSKINRNNSNYDSAHTNDSTHTAISNRSGDTIDLQAIGPSADDRYTQLVQILSINNLPETKSLQKTAIELYNRSSKEERKHFRIASGAHLALEAIDEFNTSEQLNDVIATSLDELVQKSAEELEEKGAIDDSTELKKWALYNTGALRIFTRVFYNTNQTFSFTPEHVQDGIGNVLGVALAGTKKIAMDGAGIIAGVAATPVEWVISALASMSLGTARHLGGFGELFTPSLEFLTGEHVEETLDAKLAAAQPSERLGIIIEHSFKYAFHTVVLALSLVLCVIPGAIAAFWKNPSWETIKAGLKWIAIILTSPVWVPVGLVCLVLYGLSKLCEFIFGTDFGIGKFFKAIGTAIGNFFKGFGEKFVAFLRAISFGWIDLKNVTAFQGFLMFLLVVTLVVGILALTGVIDLGVIAGGISVCALLWIIQGILDVIFIAMIASEKHERKIDQAQIAYMANALNSINSNFAIPSREYFEKKLDAEKENQGADGNMSFVGDSQFNSGNFNQSYLLYEEDRNLRDDKVTETSTNFWRNMTVTQNNDTKESKYKAPAPVPVTATNNNNVIGNNKTVAQKQPTRKLNVFSDSPAIGNNVIGNGNNNNNNNNK